jgi:5-(carboxyamino)imidazole ribonucleotide mutase
MTLKGSAEMEADHHVTPPRVSIIMGSASDYPTMLKAEQMLGTFGIPVEVRVVSAHRTPELMFDYASGARERGLQVIIAGAGGAAHLPGMVAALTTLPVLGVPIRSRALGGVDSLLSIVQMPAGVPTATFAIGKAGAINAALFAARMLAVGDPVLTARLERDRSERAQAAIASNEALRNTVSTDPERT